jgi:hypothetical protein
MEIHLRRRSGRGENLSASLRGNCVNPIPNSFANSLFSKNNRFIQEKTCQFSRRFNNVEKTGLVTSVFQLKRQPGNGMTRKMVSEIGGVKENGFLLKNPGKCYRMHPDGQGMDVDTGLIPGSRKKQDLYRFSHLI